MPPADMGLRHAEWLGQVQHGAMKAPTGVSDQHQEDCANLVIVGEAYIPFKGWSDQGLVAIDQATN